MGFHDIPQAWLYPSDLDQAKRSQSEMATHVRLEDEFEPVGWIAGTDASNSPQDPEKLIFAVLVLLRYPELTVTQVGRSQCVAPLPYIPGFLGFREAPALVEAFYQLRQKPDLILVDGHGISHPRRLGIASHLGVLLDCPTIGVAKSILVGRVDGDVGNEPGDHRPLVWKGQTLGFALRTRRNVQPVFVSPGHRVSMESALRWVMNCQGHTRLPEPTRQAHRLANQFRKELGKTVVEEARQGRFTLEGL